MPDVFSPAKRSEVMSRIRGAGNKATELRLIDLMRAAGMVGWRRGAQLRCTVEGPKVAGSRSKTGRREAMGVEEVAAPYGAAGVRGSHGGKTIGISEFQVAPIRAHPRASVVPSGSFSVRPVPSVVKTKPVVIRPDFVFPKVKVAVFVDGCFFHGCPKHATWPKNNADFWRKKIEGNRARDRRQTRLLRTQGWRVIRIWEHALTPKNAMRTLARLQAVLRGENPRTRATISTPALRPE